MARFVPPLTAKRRTLDDFGLKAAICPACGKIHPYKTGEPEPATCELCGKPLTNKPA